MKLLKNPIIILFFLPLFAIGQNSNTSLLNITEITVKPGHDAQFVQGVKLYKECYLKNKGTDHWDVWHRVQGSGNNYVLTGSMAKWADMDKKDPADDACMQTVFNFIMPHVESTNYSIARSMPDISSAPKDSTKLLWVTFFKVRNGTDFNEFIKSMEAAIKTSEGSNRGSWYQEMGGAPEAPDYFISESYTGFAGLDKNEDGIWKIYEKVNGKKAADAMKVKAREAVDKMWSYMYTLSEDLSN